MCRWVTWYIIYEWGNTICTIERSAVEIQYWVALSLRLAIYCVTANVPVSVSTFCGFSFVSFFFFLYRFTLYPVYFRVGRGNLVLSHCFAIRTPVSHFFYEFRKHCILSGGIQRRVLPRWSKQYENKCHFLDWESNPHPVALTLATLKLFYIMWIDCFL